MHCPQYKYNLVLKKMAPSVHSLETNNPQKMSTRFKKGFLWITYEPKLVDYFVCQQKMTMYWCMDWPVFKGIATSIWLVETKNWKKRWVLQFSFSEWFMNKNGIVVPFPTMENLLHPCGLWRPKSKCMEKKILFLNNSWTAPFIWFLETEKEKKHTFSKIVFIE